MAHLPSELLSPKSSQVSELFGSSYFEIPHNQRAYRWGEDPKDDQRDKLWDDLLMAVEYDCDPSNVQKMGHFLGQIVVIGQEQSLENRRLEVIDGQQRLTTLTILCACLRPFVEKISDKKKKKQLDFVITSCILAPASHNAPRIKLNRDHEFYSSSLIECETHEERQSYWANHFDSTKEVQRNVKSAFELFQTRIEEYLGVSDDKEEKDLRLIDLVEVLTMNLYFLVVRAENSWMVYRLFETLNERGLDLSQADLIKNVLLESSRASGAEQQRYVYEIWEKFVDNYEKQPEKKLDLPHLIQFSYSYRNRQVKKEMIYDAISKNLRSELLDASELVLQFQEDSDNWNKFLLGDITSWSKEQADTQYAIVDPLWKKHCAPFVMAVMDKYSARNEEMRSLMVLCENYLFRQGLICKEAVTRLQKTFSDTAELIRGGAEISEIAAYLNSASPDELFVDCFKTASVNSMKQGFYALWKIENFLLEGVSFRPKSQSAIQHLEHIMPRQPGEGWEHVKDRDEFELYKNRLGNFLILESEINQHLKNCSFENKISGESDIGYSASELRLPKELIENHPVWLNNKLWDFKSINQRQEAMALKYALLVWPLTL